MNIEPDGLSSEADFEFDVMSWLEKIGWNTFVSKNGEGGAKYSSEYNRSSDEPICYSIIEEKIKELNPNISDEEIQSAIREIRKVYQSQGSLTEINKKIYEKLVNGIDISVPNENKSRTVSLLDLNSIENNQFDAVSQFRYENSQFHERGTKNRFDIVLLINGFPFVILELKDITNENTYNEGINDILEYESDTPEVFYSGLFNISCTQQRLRYGAIDSNISLYNPWKPEDIDPDCEIGETGYDVKNSISSLCNPDKILEIFKDFVFYNVSGHENQKIVPRHQQYFATKESMNLINKARSIDKSSRGLVWHTQGSGKSFTMYYIARLFARQGKQAVIVVDRENLRTQGEEEIRKIEPGFRDNSFAVARSKTDLCSAIEENTSVVLTTIQLFENITEELKVNETLILSDEAHRAQEGEYGTGVDTAFPIDTNPLVHHLGFTGTPVQDADRDTFSNFTMDMADLTNSEKQLFDLDTPYIHRYSIKEGVDEEMIVEINLEDRSDDVKWDIDKQDIDKEMEQRFDSQLIEKHSNELSAREISELPSYVEALAEDIATYYNESCVNKVANKSMIISSSRKSAAKLYEELKDKHFKPESIGVVYTGNEDDSELLKKYQTTSDERKNLRERFKDDSDPLKIIIVCDMLLTGFDAPKLGTIFLDKKLRDVSLMQAIARANRQEDGKKYGEIIDYQNATQHVGELYDDVDEEISVYISKNKDKFIKEYDSQIAKLEDILKFYDNVTNTVQYANKIIENNGEEHYIRTFKELRDLRNAIHPDKRLKENNRTKKYKVFKQIYSTIKSTLQPDEKINKTEFIKNAKEVIENNSSVLIQSEDNDKEPDAVVEGSTGALEVKKKQRKLQEELSQHEVKNPRYKELSERVEEVIWNKGSEVSEIEDEIDQIKSDFNTKRNTNTSTNWKTQVLKDLLREDQYNIKPNSQEEKAVIDKFKELWDMTRNMSPYKRKTKIKNDFKKFIITSTADTDLTPLLNTNFVEEAVKYYRNN